MAPISSQMLKPALPLTEQITDLCDYCVNLTEAIVKHKELSDMGASEYTYICPQDPGPEVCRLCKVVTKQLSTQEQQLAKEGSNLNPMDWKKSQLEMEQNYNGGRRLYGPDSVNPRRICGVTILRNDYVVWADMGSPASAVLIDRPPILGPHMNKVCDLVQRWLNECDAHENCTPHNDTPMPTRVLALVGDNTKPSVRLIESKGRQGHYLALSHCWGKAGKLPLLTTPENYQEHQSGIPYKDLPKTFQDTVEFAQGMGIRFVWIDSLCIIQGDSRDWHSEAAKMGDVYWNAALVVAASGAKNSSEGLFISERQPSTVIQLPYMSAGECKGTFNMMKVPKDSDSDPCTGPLDRRAWTFQERYLAQRLVAFMPAGISWVCGTEGENELGNRFHGFSRQENWSYLLREYTKRSLTYASDRTEALRGIAQLYESQTPFTNERQCYRKDGYIPEYGVWKDQLMFQLLWFKSGSYYRHGRLPNMPSWSWAATDSAKLWPNEGIYIWNSTRLAEHLPEQLLITSSGPLQIRGHMSTIQSMPSYVEDEFTAHDLELDVLQWVWGSWCGRSEDFTTITQDTNDGYDKAVLGLAIFDDDSTTTYTHACLLAKQEDRSKEFVPARGKRGVKLEFIDDVVYHTERYPAFMYWALLLELVDGKKFKRVGIASLLPVAYEAFQFEVQDFEIV